jgi:hypothetical protein
VAAAPYPATGRNVGPVSAAPPGRFSGTGPAATQRFIQINLRQQLWGGDQFWTKERLGKIGAKPREVRLRGKFRDFGLL